MGPGEEEEEEHMESSEDGGDGGGLGIRREGMKTVTFLVPAFRWRTNFLFL